jgi:predicted CoA-binding protein
MSKEYESFWDCNNFAVITDQTKPAMKWASNELKKRGNTVHIVDLSNRPVENALTDTSELPDGIEAAIIGVTTKQPADVVEALAGKGIKKIWIHWMTDTPEALEQCSQHQMECLTNRCPMMYLGGSISIHAVHRNIAKLVGKY